MITNFFLKFTGNFETSSLRAKHSWRVKLNEILPRFTLWVGFLLAFFNCSLCYWLIWFQKRAIGSQKIASPPFLTSVRGGQNRG